MYVLVQPRIPRVQYVFLGHDAAHSASSTFWRI